MLDIIQNRAKVAIALKLMRNLREREKEVTHASLQENVATLVSHEAKRRLNRTSTSDDDEEFYAIEDKIVEEAYNLIETLLRNAID